MPFSSHKHKTHDAHFGCRFSGGVPRLYVSDEIDTIKLLVLYLKSSVIFFILYFSTINDFVFRWKQKLALPGFLSILSSADNFMKLLRVVPNTRTGTKRG
jgi:hypothetical protein